MNTPNDNPLQKLSGRLVSLDVFRGATIAAMILVNNPGSWSHIYSPLEHAEWNGWTFTDLIFPFFLFIVGVAIVYAFSRHLKEGLPKKSLYIKIVRRTLILFALGVFLNGFPFFELSTLRFLGVLQRIAICYFFASVIFLHSDVKGQVYWIIGLLLAYWGLMEWMPFPGAGADVFEKGRNFSNYLDQIILGNHVWQYSKPWDPEGIVSTLPAIATTLFGVLTGHFLRGKKTPIEKTAYMLLMGNFLLWLGTFWNYWMPINKSIWTSSYSVTMAGLALIVLSFCYFFIDIKGYQKWAKPFIVYGTNAITIFVLSGILGKSTILIKLNASNGETIALKTWLYNLLYASWLDPINASLAYAIGFIVFMFLVAWVMYRKKIFIKI
jgi:predicted acyltransferase